MYSRAINNPNNKPLQIMFDTYEVFKAALNALAKHLIVLLKKDFNDPEKKAERQRKREKKRENKMKKREREE